MGIIFLTAVNAVVPILLLILLGYFLQRIGFLNDSFSKTGNELVFKVCLPVMLFVNIYNIAGFSAIDWTVVLYAMGALGILILIGVIVALTATKVAQRKGVLMQCVYRSNFAIIGLPLASALGGDAAAATAAVLSAFIIPTINATSVVALTVFLEKKSKIDVWKIVKGILKNPLILGVCAGLLALGIRQAQVDLFGEVVFSLQRDTTFLYTTLNNIKAITSPFALIVMGARFKFSAVRGLFKEIAIGTAFRIIVAPLVGVGLAVLLSKGFGWFDFGNAEYPALIALFGSPVAVASAVMAAGMKNDEQLATQLVVWTSVLSILTVFITACIMMWAGLITT